MSFIERYGPWAAITGAAQGIGAAFADELGARGLSLLVIDRDQTMLAERADALRGTGVEVRALVVDLADESSPALILAAMAEVDVGLLVNNAALSVVSRFVDQSIESARTQLHVNCRVPLELVHALLPGFVARRRGGVILLSSGSAMRGSALVASYAATKAWNLLLAESLWDEVRDDGVDVLAVLPGTTRTPGWLSTNPQASHSTSSAMEPAEVVAEALDALGRQPSIQPGQANRDSEAFLANLDRAKAVKIVGDVMRQTYPG